MSQDLKDDLWEQGVELVTAIRQNMKPQLMTLQNKLLLQRRFIIETIFGRLKQGYQMALILFYSALTLQITSE